MKTMKKTVKFGAATLLAITLSSCHIYNKYELPTENDFVKEYATSLEAGKDSVGLPYMTWEEVFTDPILQGYIRKALTNNTDLENARLNVDVARAQLKGAKLSYFPSVALTPNGGMAKYQDIPSSGWSYSIPMNISWEIDVFAKILNRKRGAQVSVDLMKDYEAGVRSQIICGVASTYYGLVLLNQQLALTKRTSEIWKDQVESMKLMKEAAMVNEAAVVQSEANYWSIMASIPDIEAGIRQMQNTLALLLHEYPQPTYEVTNDLTFDLPVSLADGLPISYLAARPDVQAAERKLATAYYATNSARAAFYPGLTISSQGGFTNLLGSMISNPGKWFVQLAGSLAAPIFSRGQNIATLEAAKLQQKQAMNDFEKTVLSAASDVSNAFATYDSNRQKREYLIKQIDKLEKSVEYTQELLTLDQRTTYLEVLTAQSSLLSAQLSSLSCWHNKVSSLISIYQAAGGGR